MEGRLVKKVYEKRGERFVCVETYESPLTKAQLERLRQDQVANRTSIQQFNAQELIANCDAEIAKIDAALA